MSDSVNRIAPPSVSMDRPKAPTREREKKKRGDERGIATEPKESGPVENLEAMEPDGDKRKGTKLDISA